MMLFSIKYLRFIAAVMVVLFHATQSLHHDFGSEALPRFLQGARGVDIFFVISGFIIVYVSRNATYDGWTFLIRRFARVAPPYYLASAVMLVVALIAPQILKSTTLTWPHTIASFLFIPWDNPETASAFPLLQVGWTLNAEMQFYAIFAAVFFLPSGLRAMAASCVIFAIVLLGLLVNPENQTLAAWTNPILIEFIFGMAIALLWEKGLIRGWYVLGWAICALGTVLILSLPIVIEGLDTSLVFLMAGLPAAMIVYGLLIVEKALTIRDIPWLGLLGDASYALYIWHFFVLGAVRVFWKYTDFEGVVNDIMFICAVLATSITMSTFAYLWLERPLVALAARRLANRHNPLPAPAA
jgi:exopolysaccharide production protein ExoZ